VALNAKLTALQQAVVTQPMPSLLCPSARTSVLQKPKAVLAGTGAGA